MDKDIYIAPNLCLSVHTDELLFGIDMICFEDFALVRIGFACFSINFAF